jgi:hypothetical protein
MPIGSGEIESAHRYIAQQRLKLPGPWWRTDHADYKLARRITRKDGDGPAYWARSAGMGQPPHFGAHPLWRNQLDLAGVIARNDGVNFRQGSGRNHAFFCQISCQTGFAAWDAGQNQIS